MGEIPPFDTNAAAAARAHQLRLTKPPGSLGRLEELAVWYAGARGSFPVDPPARAELFVFAADHGVTAEGVSAYPSAVTAAMVANFLGGGAAVNVLARSCGVELTVVDVGVDGDVPVAARAASPAFVSEKVRRGTGNLRREPAMTRTEAEAAVALGDRLAGNAVARGAGLLAAGEMGIGNTTAAAAVACALAGLAPDAAVGRGSGVGERGVALKADVVRDALALHRPDPADPAGVLAAVGGLEIAAMAGLMLGGARRRVPVVVDGFISSAAALVAVALAPGARAYLCFSHLSHERGHRALGDVMDARPLLDLDMRLGEGTGAVLATHLIRAAVRLQREMATFESAGVPGPEAGYGSL
jgi:nicotinate-nucleotide--dimethylbenzimidazole phosphoribosyltransferase